MRKLLQKAEKKKALHKQSMVFWKEKVKRLGNYTTT